MIPLLPYMVLENKDCVRVFFIYMLEINIIFMAEKYISYASGVGSHAQDFGKARRDQPISRIGVDSGVKIFKVFGSVWFDKEVVINEKR